ncbi:hypothetical protein Poli38472_005211 [Pythium oligandrum]|uniref:Uncharacterized protein n=1 Tax=Pythium oligandrum TaxID=41045 RepID=A0A8K1FLE4_PYTOL|nr:hypothetical protein Poli38472_005211 [Pythium oligandrum]|eukprot:TMW62593.1 hypothetical protein Poli38472_005211 [Pythium oligandrum]
MPDPQWQPRLDQTEFRSLIQATPALGSLELVFPVRHITEGQQFRCDEVLTDLATHCPQLEAIRLRPELNVPTTIGWKALMAMPRLAHVDVNKLEDETNTSLVDALRLCPMKVHRHIDLQILGLKHPVIWNMLQYLDSQESERIQQLHLSIKLERDEFADGFPHFRLPAVSMRELDDTLARIQAKYGNSITRLHVLVKEMVDNGVSGALLFGCELWINHVEPGKGDKCKFDREIYRMTMG